jgi:hypothetical protein
MKNHEALNTKRIDILLSFLTIICAPCFDKQSESDDYCKEELGATFSSDRGTRINL